MKKVILYTLAGTLVLGAGCTKQPYYNIPTDANGDIVITDISTCTTSGITTLDDEFTVNATFHNAKEGDAIKAELLKSQIPQGGGSEQLLPLAGTQKDITLGSDLKASISFTKAEAQMMQTGDFVLVTFAGKTASAQVRVDLAPATSVSGPEFNGEGVNIIRTAGTAYFNINVEPKSGAYTGQVIVKRKNGINEPWVNVGAGSYTTPAQIPVSGNDFAAGKDTMYYSFVAEQGDFVDSVTREVIAEAPSFFLKRSGTLSLTDATQGGINLMTGTAVAENDAHAILSIGSGSLMLKGGTAWTVGGKSISFVPSTAAIYDANNSLDAINAFNAGSPVSTVAPGENGGIYIYKIVNGPNPADIFYGVLKVTKIVPGTSVDLEYRIGNIYEHMSALQ